MKYNISRETIVDIEFYKGGDGDHIHLGEVISSGCDYKIDNIDDVINIVKEYIINNGIMKEE